jgi:hypothetical protein
MARIKIVNKRRIMRDARSEGGKKSRYGQKIALQKRGIFSPTSPFIIHEGTVGVSLQELNRRRFK